MTKEELDLIDKMVEHKIKAMFSSFKRDFLLDLKRKFEPKHIKFGPGYSPGYKLPDETESGELEEFIIKTMKARGKLK